jgi:hypothetical protein
MLALKFPKLSMHRISALMIPLVITIQFLVQQKGYAQQPSPQQPVMSLRAGDILLVPLNCYVCNAIEKETGVPYSHSVVVANSSTNLADIEIYEAWGTTRRTPLLEILKRTEKGQSLFHMRPREFTESQSPDEKTLAAVFDSRFAPSVFDDEFLWDNTDERGVEKIYCAEFVVKFINAFLENPQPPEPMQFGRLRDFWEKYYRQFDLEIPEGKPGVSPALIYFSERFVRLGSLETK